MIPFETAFTIVLENTHDFGTVSLKLEDSPGRILAEDIFADRDFPPFDRATRDGIAINAAGLEQGNTSFAIQGIVAAGSTPVPLENETSCVEIMTGAMVPENADTVVMYEHLEIKDKKAVLQKPVQPGQNIHKIGSDQGKGDKVLGKGTKIHAAEIGVLASVGKTGVLVRELPKTAIIATGNELVAPSETPKPHQVRTSNSYTLSAALKKEGIASVLLHFPDDWEHIQEQLGQALQHYDVLLLSGGVSKGKYDFLPEVLEKLGVTKLFHKVQQRPGKPFWFGKHHEANTTVFAFPGNPGSTFASYHVYFLPWLSKSLGITIQPPKVYLEEAFSNEIALTRFIRAFAYLKEGQLYANIIHGNGSGDLTSLTQANGFLVIGPEKEHTIGDLVPFIPTQNIV